MTNANLPQSFDLTPYQGRWIAVVQHRVIGVGFSREQAYRAAKQARPKDKPAIFYVPAEGERTGLASPDFLQQWLAQQPLLRETIQVLNARRLEAYLVGGAVRDMLLGRPHVLDLDFAVPDDGLAAARVVANALDLAFYPLDVERKTGRAVGEGPGGGKIYLDFAAYRGLTLEADLAGRDFTINAMALSLAPAPQLIDPLGGQQDLAQQVIRATSANTFQHDPVRVLRAVRLAAALEFSIEAQTEVYLRHRVDQLDRVSAERQRDELVKLLNSPAPGRAVEMLADLEVLPQLLPEVAAVRGVAQSAPHYLDVFQHTLAALEHWAAVASTGAFGLSESLEAKVRQYLEEPLAGDVSIAQVMPLAILLHDTGKPLARTETVVDGQPKIRFVGHERESANLARRVMNRFRFSGQAVSFVDAVAANHMRPLLLVAGGSVSRRAIYRFFRDTSGSGFEAGPAVALHALVDHWATYPPGQGTQQEARLQRVVHKLLSAYFEQREQVVDPPPLLSGRDLMDLFGLEEGRLIGQLLKNLREAQASGQVQDREAAIAFVKADPNFAHHQE